MARRRTVARRWTRSGPLLRLALAPVHRGVRGPDGGVGVTTDRQVRFTHREVDERRLGALTVQRLAHQADPRGHVDLFDALPDHSNIGLEWEPCHQLGQLIDPIPQLRQWIGKVFHVHGKDASLYRDVIAREGISGSTPHYHHRHPGFGDTNWADIISILRLANYTSTIDIEGWHDPVYKDDLEMTGQVHALRYLQNCRGGSYVPNPTV